MIFPEDVNLPGLYGSIQEYVDYLWDTDSWKREEFETKEEMLENGNWHGFDELVDNLQPGEKFVFLEVDRNAWAGIEALANQLEVKVIWLPY